MKTEKAYTILEEFGRQLYVRNVFIVERQEPA